jgi:membrane glycosyltransferase
MVVLDADSLMTGEAIHRLVQLMERNRRVGIIQGVPLLANAETIIARLQQFASRLYGPVSASGLNYWQLSEANYWGHNAIIRLAPFIRHCSLPELPGTGPFGGRILSHDYVEAALMRRAGWEVWLATGLEGNYEECPPTVIDLASATGGGSRATCSTRGSSSPRASTPSTGCISSSASSPTWRPRCGSPSWWSRP